MRKESSARTILSANPCACVRDASLNLIPFSRAVLYLHSFCTSGILKRSSEYIRLKTLTFVRDMDWAKETLRSREKCFFF